MFRVALHIAVGIFLVVANVWFVRSVYRAFFGTSVLNVRIQVIGPKEGVANFERGLAHMVTTRLRKIKEDLKEANGTQIHSDGSKQSPEDSIELGAKANPILPTFRRIDYSVLLRGEVVRIPDESPIKVAIGGVEVEGLIGWIKKQFNAPHKTVSFTVFISSEGKKAFIAGNLQAIRGVGKDVVWTEASPSANEIAETIAHTVAQKEMTCPNFPVDALNSDEFQTLLFLLVRINALNKKLERKGYPVTHELKQLLPRVEALREKVPHWHQLTYLTASISDSIGQNDKALLLYKELQSIRDVDVGEFLKLEAHNWDHIADRINSLVIEPEIPPVKSELLNVEYGQALLTSNRKVSAVLEIGLLANTEKPLLEVQTTEGTQNIQSILKEVGIQLTVKWGTELPVSVMGPDGRFSDEELMSTMEQYRGDIPSDVWHFYLIYGGRSVHAGVKSMIFDSKRRRGAAVFEHPGILHPNETLFMILHEMGHMLNLPHPWQAYGDTKSVMSFSHRWGKDWSWNDPSVYRFDKFGLKHIQRGPVRYVRPGASPFLDYGTPLPWDQLRRLNRFLDSPEVHPRNGTDQ